MGVGPVADRHALGPDISDPIWPGAVCGMQRYTMPYTWASSCIIAITQRYTIPHTWALQHPREHEEPWPRQATNARSNKAHEEGP